MIFQRITVDPEVFGGKPCIRGTRIAVSLAVRDRTLKGTVGNHGWTARNTTAKHPANDVRNE